MTATSGTSHRQTKTIGIIVEADHPVYSVVADELRERGYDVRRFEPQRRIERAEVDELGLLVNKRMCPESFHALLYADRTDVPTWNSFVSNVVFTARLTALHALERVGFTVPDIYFEKPAGDYVAKSLFDMDTNDEPVIGGEGEFYQKLIRTQPVDYKHYAVAVGEELHTSVLKVKSKLFGEKEILGNAEADKTIIDRIRQLMKLTDSYGINVDIVEGENEIYAVDVNPAPSFEGTGLEDELTDSMELSLEKEKEVKGSY
ncbi:MAG: hypothetical protein SXQ77_08900 [Halobacteria archaeon]|nr:hypothetical protein [Halobacteria archaeon]